MRVLYGVVWMLSVAVNAIVSAGDEATGPDVLPLGSIEVMSEPELKPKWYTWIARQITQAAGLPRMRDFRFRDLLGEVFGRHSGGDIEEFFMVGSHATTPAIQSIDTDWPRPWIFFRTFLATLVVYLAFHFAWTTFGNARLIPGLIVTGSFAMPIATVILFVELNARRNVSMYQVSKMVIAGGLLAMIISLLLFELSDVFGLGWLGGSIGGLVEEPAKVLALLLVASLPRYKYILNGLLFGAAVGAGFAAFESAGYAFVVAAEESDPGLMTSVILVRGLLSPLGHIVWGGMCGGALWKVKGDRLFRFGMLVDPGFLRVLAFAVILHVIWNAPIYVPFFGKYLLVGFVGWIVVMGLVSDGLRQVREEKEELEEREEGP